MLLLGQELLLVCSAHPVNVLPSNIKTGYGARDRDS